MSSVTRRVLRRQGMSIQGMPPSQLPSPQDLSEKIQQIMQVGEQLSNVAGQINQVNGQLKNLDQVVAEVKAARDLLEEIVREQSRQRYVSLAMLKYLSRESLIPYPDRSFEDLEKGFRAEFNNTHNLPAEP